MVVLTFGMGSGYIGCLPVEKLISAASGLGGFL